MLSLHAFNLSVCSVFYADIDNGHTHVYTCVDLITFQSISMCGKTVLISYFHFDQVLVFIVSLCNDVNIKMGSFALASCFYQKLSKFPSAIEFFVLFF